MWESLNTLADLLTQPEFITGIGVGALALLGMALIPVDSAGRLSAWGGVFALAAALAINFATGRNLPLIAGVLLLVAGGALLDRGTKSDGEGMTIVAWLVIVTGAFVMSTRSGLDGAQWIRAGLVVVGVGTGIATWRSPESINPWLIGPMMAITAFGIWTTVPDTEIARVLLGVSIPMALGTLPMMKGALNPAGALGLYTLVAWVTAEGGDPRPASVIGGWACLGLLALAPLAARRLATVRIRPGTVLTIHIVLVIVSARVIGLWHSAQLAVVAVAILAGLGIWSLLLFSSEEEPANA